MNICFSWSRVGVVLSFLVFPNITAFSSSDSTVIFQSVDFKPPLIAKSNSVGHMGSNV